MLNERASDLPLADVDRHTTEQELPGAFDSAFGQDVTRARQRMERMRTLLDQLTLALRMAEGVEGIDRATLPLSLPLGPGKLKELGALLRLSPFLRADLQTIFAFYHCDREALERLERAARLEAARPELLLSDDARTQPHGLFQWLNETHVRFRDCPALQDLLTADDPGHELTSVVKRDLPLDLEELFVARRMPARIPVPCVALPSAVPPVLGRMATIFRDVQNRLNKAPSVAKSQPNNGPTAEELRKPEAVLDVMAIPPLKLELGFGLVMLVDPALGGDLVERISEMRERIALGLGFVVPGVQCQTRFELPENAYVIRVRGHVVARGQLMHGFMAACPQAQTNLDEELAGFAFTQPGTGRQAYWVPHSSVSRKAERLGYAMLDACGVLMAHLEEAVTAHAHDVLSFEEVKLVLDRLAVRAPTVVRHVLERMDFAEIHQVLRALLRERVSIRDLPAILERLGHLLVVPRQDPSGQTPGAVVTVHLDASDQHVARQVERLERVLPKPYVALDTAALVEALRQSLSREICAPLSDAQDNLDVITFTPQLEAQLLDALMPGREARFFGLTPAFADRLLATLLHSARHLEVPIVVCDARLRAAFKRFTARSLPRLHVLSHAELHAQFQVHTVATVGLDAPSHAREP